MHEVSMARTILETVREHCPPGETVREVTVRIGPLRWIEPEALQAGWEIVTAETALEGAALRMERLPWTIRCEACDGSYNSHVPDEACPCGSRRVRPEGGDEITLVSLEVGDET
jgi:hydrogenase nickel insertion protein HypA